MFTDRGDPAEDVDLTKHTDDVKTQPGRSDYHARRTSRNDQVITRVEFRRADDYPLALGPRLPVV